MWFVRVILYMSKAKKITVILNVSFVFSVVSFRSS